MLHDIILALFICCIAMLMLHIMYRIGYDRGRDKSESEKIIAIYRTKLIMQNAPQVDIEKQELKASLPFISPGGCN